MTKLKGTCIQRENDGYFCLAFVLIYAVMIDGV